jgi:hypothetical protein
MNGIFEAALEVQEYCNRRQWRCCIIGGLAVVRWGEPATVERLAALRRQLLGA